MYISTKVAFGTYNDTMDTTGWGILHIETNTNFEDTIQAYGAGYLEAAFTQTRVYQMYENLFDFYFPNETDVPENIQNWFTLQDSWMRQMIQSNPSDNYWQAVALIISQYDGFVAGYQDNSNGYPLELVAFQVLNAAGDLLDLIPALNETKRTKWNELSEKEFRMEWALNGHCSALIKVTSHFPLPPLPLFSLIVFCRSLVTTLTSSWDTARGSLTALC
jgi:hypothetical protein